MDFNHAWGLFCQLLPLPQAFTKPLCLAKSHYLTLSPHYTTLLLHSLHSTKETFQVHTNVKYKTRNVLSCLAQKTYRVRGHPVLYFCSSNGDTYSKFTPTSVFLKTGYVISSIYIGRR